MKKSLKLIIIITFIFLILFFLLDKKETEIEELNTIEPILEEEPEPIIETIQVEIKGEVLSPGVYELPSNSRVIDLIHLAGGLTENAVIKNINQAKKLLDEMVIVIYNQNDLVDEIKTEYVYLECTCPEVKNDACIQENPFSDDNLKEDTKISINTASLEQLMTIDGIGEKTATKIVEYRKEHSFETIEDIKQVSGIGDSLYEKIKDFITI